MTAVLTPQTLMPPDDDYNRELLRNVRPADWKNPKPSGRYNLVVVGAGTAGLVTAAIAAGLGAKVALIERHLMGGDCLNVGCVPSKALIRASRLWAEVRHTEDFGVHVTQDAMAYDFGAAMARMRQVRARLSPTDSAQRFQRMGVDVFLGEGRFIGAETIAVDGQHLRFKKAVICSGGRAVAPPIAGLHGAGYLTNETVFSLTQLPRRLAVIGAGPVGAELAQAFARFGSQVWLFERMGQILPNEDHDAAQVVQAQMAQDGVQFVFNAKVIGIGPLNRAKIVQYQQGLSRNRLVEEGGTSVKEVDVDEILIAVGRAPNVEGLGLETVGVDYDSSVGVKVNGRLQTTNPRIYAAGDICFPFKFTHSAEAMAQIVVQNALFPHPFGLGYTGTGSLIIPWCTYTSPEVAHVGLYEATAKAKGLRVETYTHHLSDVDRAVLDGDEQGFVRVHIKTGTDQILGATIVAAHAGDMISEITALLTARKGLKTLAATIHPYPTQAEALRKVANVWRKARFNDRQKRMLTKWFQWSR